MKTLFLKDLRCLWRAQQLYLSVVFLSLLFVVLASVAFREVGFGQAELRSETPGILWLIFLFSGVTGLNHSFSVEQENGALTALLLTGIDPAIVFLSKFGSNLLFLFSIQIGVIVLHQLFFGVQMQGSELVGLIAVTALVAVGFVALGTLLSGVASTANGSQVLLPLILFPLCIPLLAAGVFLSRDVLGSGEVNIQSFWFMLLLAFDVIFFTLGLVLFEFAVVD